VTVRAVREELAHSPSVDHVTFAMRGAAAYQAFEAALAEVGSAPAGTGRPGGGRAVPA